jgi:anaerobic magnesium-protoporphyrin IX monomethyl ester cyclase
MPKRVDLLLVNPGNRPEQFAKLHELAPVAQPLGIAILAAIARAQGLSVEICDAEVEFWTPEKAADEIAARWDPRVAGMTAFTTKMTAAGLILKKLKEKLPRTVTVLGGHHASAAPERTLLEEAADFVVAGEGFDPIIRIVHRVKEKQLSFGIPGVWYRDGSQIVSNGLAKGPDNLDELPFAAWDLLPMEKYRTHHWQT